MTPITFELLLKSLGFTKNGSVYEKTFREFKCSMRVDFKRRKLIYPAAIRGGHRNDSFDSPENFVVFECVHRLLEKGYRPEHIELEKPWSLGHTAKGGRGDICVYGPDGQMLLIIECKTWGREFDKAYKDTLNDGAQLFSYWQQEHATRWLVLYASDYTEAGIIYKAPTINCSDDANIIQIAKNDKEIRLYAGTSTAEDKYAVWKETYLRKIYDDLVFCEDTVAYHVGIPPLRKGRLNDFTPNDKIVNRFEEILRHNNVSDKENAFNRLLALFICKLVDESTKGENDEVEFQYKVGTDTYETLQDRLQRLHTEGMQQFMQEKIFYVSADYPERLFSTYTGQQRKQAIEDLKNTIRILKFYSNNDFSFKDVHNEEQFFQNGKILVEVVQLFEGYRIVYPSKHQFLGDLFEQLLNKGFKQNEGQFFTPMPITRFIWDCLPLARMTHTDQGMVYPKIIDYACGAGHFLTEAVEAINAYIPSGGDNAWVRDHIYGVEKDYRLARVSKISLFMNGAGGGNIVFGDGLENTPDKHIENGAFDILVANPPYSVAEFKRHLSLKNNRFELLDRIGDSGSEIEVLFVERISQLLRPGGIAAVILPSSILSNDSASYTGAREVLLSNFYIRAIVQLGGKTFGATGTNTVILFLEKYEEPPKRKELISDSVTSILSGNDLEGWEDEEILDAYLAQQELSAEVYLAFTQEKSSVDALSQTPYFEMYTRAFLARTEIVKYRKSKQFLKMTPEQQTEEISRRFYEYAKKQEFEKLLYFALTYRQRTVIVTAPADNGGQKEFLGYDWSNRKGSEGIQILTPGGKLYNPNDRSAGDTLAAVIRGAFQGEQVTPAEEGKPYAAWIHTCDMLDYSRLNFNKALRTNVEKPVEFSSRYPLMKIDHLNTLLKRGKSPIYGDSHIQVIKSGQARGFHSFDFSNKYYLAPHVDLDERKLQKGDILINSTGVGTAGRVTAFQLDGDYVADSHITICRPNGKVLSDYLMLVLAVGIGSKRLEQMADGSSGQIELPLETIRNIRIPVPPLPVQRQIISEYQQIDTRQSELRSEADACREKIEALFQRLDAASADGGQRLRLADNSKFSLSIGKRVLNTELVSEGTIPVFSANVWEPFGYIDRTLITDFSRDSILWGIDGDWMVHFYPKDKPFYPTDHCGVLRVLTDEVNPRYMARVLETEGKKLRFSRSYRASIDRVSGISFSVPDIDLQNEVIPEIIQLEHQIAAAQKSLDVLTEQTEGILKKYLF